MAYIYPEFSAEELALRYLDIKACESLLGRHTYLYLQCKTREELSTLWCSEKNRPSLGYNNGKYEGYDAIFNFYVEAFEQRIKDGDRRMKDTYPDLRDATTDEIYGVGTMYVDTFTTPVIELATDAQTAKGLWYSPGIVTQIEGTHPQGYWEWKKVGVDFLKENGTWKLWHVQFAVDFRALAGSTWANGSIPLGPLVPPNAPASLYNTYSVTQKPQSFPRIPEPYDTFANTFSY